MSAPKQMESTDYTTTIEVPGSPHDVFNRLTDVSKWWSNDFEGSSTSLNDEFVIHHPGRHYTKQRLVEVVPDKRVVWLVTECRLYWLEKDKSEWKDTKMVFEIAGKGDATVLRFTHEGLVPGKECYTRCEQGWNMVIKDRLYHFLTDANWRLPVPKSAFVYVTYIRTTPEEVWKAITSAHVLKQCWLGSSIESDWKVGSSWKATSPDGTLFDAGEVLESVPQRVLAFNWRNEWVPEFKAEGYSHCVYDIEPVGATVRFRVTHSIAQSDSKFIASVAGAWPMVASNLKSILETGEAALVDNPRHTH